jgi:uncharacterized protein YegL
MQSDSPACLKYTKVFDKYIVGELHATVDKKEIEQIERPPSCLILCLDKSGSMGGQPIEAVRKGAYEVAKMHSTNSVFEKFLTITFDYAVKSYEYKDLEKYKTKNDNLNASGGTSFDAVFRHIHSLYTKNYRDYKDCTIMFMTDGITSTGPALDSLNKMKKQLDTEGVVYRFFCIGFSQNHDADLLSQIARSGTEMGNFVYIRENSENFENDIIGALTESFKLAPNANSLKARVCENKQKGYSMNARLDIVKEGEAKYMTKIVLPLEILDSGITVEFDFAKFEVECIELQEQGKEEALNQIIYFFNLQIFSFITQAQSEDNKEKLEKILEETNELDQKLTEYYQEGLTIKVKEQRKKILEPIQDLKSKIVALLSFLRDKSLGKGMTNDFIASLNAMAYSGVRGNAMQKKLNARAIENEKRYKELKEKLKKYVDGLDMEMIMEKNKDISEQVGDCFLTTKNVFECIKDQDCLCLCLDVARSEAAIADPTKLVIRKIIPNFLSADSYIEAASFALGFDSEAHGGFDKNNEANILVGAGREKINGALPLFLFKEHFKISRDKVPQILGLMCTCDPMGYTPAQFFIVPFLVLHRAFTDYHSKETDMRGFILDQCYLVCKKILLNIDKEGLEKTNKDLENIVKDPLYSTQEHLPSIPLLLSKLLVLKRSNNLKLDKEDLEWIFLSLIEEFDRRSLDQKNSKIPNSDICKKFLYPNLEDAIQDILKSQIEAQKSSLKKRDAKEEDKLGDMEVDGESRKNSIDICFCKGDTCKLQVKSSSLKKSKKAKKSKIDEKEEKKEKFCPNIKDFIMEELEKKKEWENQISNPDSPLGKLMKERASKFSKYQFWLKSYANYIIGENSEVTKRLNQKGLPYSDKELAAVFLQNTQY